MIFSRTGITGLWFMDLTQDNEPRQAHDSAKSILHRELIRLSYAQVIIPNMVNVILQISNTAPLANRIEIRKDTYPNSSPLF